MNRLSIPSDKDAIVKLTSLKDIITNYDFIAVDRGSDRPEFFSRGITADSVKNVRGKLTSIYSNDFLTQALEADITISQLKKYYAIVHSTATDFLPEITDEMLLPFYIKKTLMGKIRRSDIEDNTGALEITRLSYMQGDSWEVYSDVVRAFMTMGYSRELVTTWLARYGKIDDDSIIYKDYHEADNILLKAISSRKGGVASLRDVEDPQRDMYSPDQVEAIDSASKIKISRIVGGAGTGKTTTAHAIVQKIEKPSRVLALAPTHKAKVRMNTTQMASYGPEEWKGPQTIHSIGYKCIYSTQKLPTITTLVIDEIGMVGSEHSHLLTAMIQKLNIKNLIFLGDPEQLSPVGLGSLIDILDAAEVPVFRLTTCHRSVKDIYDMCTSILEKNHLPKNCLDLLEINEPFIHDHKKAFCDEFLSAYKTVVKEAYDDEDKSAFVAIAYTNLAVNRLNLLTYGLVGDIEDKKELNRIYKDGKKLPPELIRKGDVIIVDINIPDSAFVKGTRGEVIKKTVTRYGKVLFTIKDFLTGQVKTDVGSSYISLGYACTVHKMQGDEAESVAYIWSDIDTRSLAYTACSRPKKRLYAFVPASDEAFVPLKKDKKRKTTFLL